MVQPDPPDPVRLEGFGPSDLYQKREKIYTRSIQGTFQRLRALTGWPLLIGYFATPWLQWNGKQAIWFDLPARQFHFFDFTIWPQDLWMLGLALMTAAFALFATTTVVGRLWCGYSCPQTVWTAIFMWAEQLTEGSRHKRIRLDKAPWSAEKLARRTAKHGMWLGWAALTGLTFVGYFEPIRDLAMSWLTLEVSGWPLFWTLFFTAATYVNAGWMREQVCIYMCPYARFQSAMIDADTLIVSYDAARGEPRGSRKRHMESGALGDCIDCQLCVQVCPTGIDIRDGLQYQCIGCAHCVDACAQTMEQMNYSPGLIRYSTANELNGGPRRWLRARSLGYAAVTLALSVGLLTALSTRASFSFDVIRDRGQLFHDAGHGLVRNDYVLKVFNKTSDTAVLTLSVANAPGVTLSEPQRLEVPAGAAQVEALVLEGQPTAPNVPVQLSLCRGSECVEEEIRFLSPGSPQGARQ